MEESKFSILDYTVMISTVVASMAIGLYNGLRGGSKTAEEYSMAGRNMTPFPVALSLLATFIAANMILGN